MAASARTARTSTYSVTTPWAPTPLRTLHPRANFEYRLTPTPIGGTAKRALDIAGALALLLALAPILLATAALIRLDSAGPALFRQARTGFRGRSFNIYKFRTMQVSPATADLKQAVRGDVRVTRIGRLLRRCSVDELPQLLNVLVGDMSLVGPRPHAVSHDYTFAGVDRAYPRRFCTRPGITGLAQVTGSRGQSETPEKIKARITKDLDYIDNWSMAGDFRIMIATVRVVLHDPNAY